MPTRPTRRAVLAAAAVAPVASATAADPPPPPARPRPSYTTPPPPVDAAVAVPELAGKARGTVRLHPRPGRPAADGSGLGGMLLWPRAEAWPTCREHRAPLIPVLQLRKDDVPEIGFRPGTDLFQLLWCPRDHADAAPRPSVHWRAAAAVRDALPAAPATTGATPEYLPKPCMLHPERVFTYPDAWELTEAQKRAVADSPELAAVARRVARQVADEGGRPHDATSLYHAWLGSAPGTRVGGYPDWVQDPAYPKCDCGAEMAHLLTLASWEWDGASYARWMPAEEPQRGPAGPAGRAPGWMLGDAGNFYLFVCRRCDDRPVRWALQSS